MRLQLQLRCSFPFVLFLSAYPGVLFAQATTGILEGLVRDESGHRESCTPVVVQGPLGLRWDVTSDSRGRFVLVLPYGNYRITAPDAHALASSDTEVHITPLQVTRLELVIQQTPTQPPRNNHCGAGSDPSPPFASSGRSIGLETNVLPEADSVQSLLLLKEPTTVTEPLDFAGLFTSRIFLQSQRAFSWTDTNYRLQGMDATDSYEPGRPVVLPDVQAIDAVVLSSGLDIAASQGYGSEIGLFLREPGQSWHGSLASTNTGGSLASRNLSGAAAQNFLAQSERFRWFTRDNLQIGGPISRRADLFLSGTGQWASQTVPQSTSGQDLKSRLLFANVRGRVRLSDDQLDGQLSGSRIDLSRWGLPVGLATLTGRRMGPSSYGITGFSGLAEVDHLDFMQLGWTRQIPASSGIGAVQMRYGFSISHLDTRPADSAPYSGPQSRAELLGGIVTGAAPLSNFAVRTRHELEGVFEPRDFRLGSTTHRIVLGGGWKVARPRNRLNSPYDLNLITAAGSPAFVVQLNTPVDSRARVLSASTHLRDEIRLKPWLSLDLAAVGDFSRGSLPAQFSHAGTFVPSRSFPGRSGAIAWNNISPRAGIAFTVPRLPGLVFRGSYSRRRQDLSARDLDFANPNSLGGLEYQWIDSDHDGIYQPGETGALLRRFGGPYSSISPSLKRPFADEFNIAVEATLPWKSFARLQLFRRDEKNRLAVINTGVPPTAYRPVVILDPGPDFQPGTFDDQRLVVFEQNPATFGQDSFLLTNPKGLRMLNTGLLAEVGSRMRSLQVHASFVAEKSYGPTNPGNSVYENDPGVVGALYEDPNTLINAAGRSFFDRAFVGKLQLAWRLPRSLGGIEVENLVNYFDGLVFARRLLVTGLAQGPFLVDTTVRGSPEGGNRTEFIANWSLQLSRTFPIFYGRIGLAAQVLNVTNASNHTQESDLSGPLFNQRLPIAVQTPRVIRFSLRYEF